MHTKIMIIGSPGSGKSTFARKLRDKTGLPLFYLDMIKHKPDRTTISSEEFDKKLKEILVKRRYALGGNWGNIWGRIQTMDSGIFRWKSPWNISASWKIQR